MHPSMHQSQPESQVSVCHAVNLSAFAVLFSLHVGVVLLCNACEAVHATAVMIKLECLSPVLRLHLRMGCEVCGKMSMRVSCFLLRCT